MAWGAQLARGAIAVAVVVPMAIAVGAGGEENTRKAAPAVSILRASHIQLHGTRKRLKSSRHRTASKLKGTVREAFALGARHHKKRKRGYPEQEGQESEPLDPVEQGQIVPPPNSPVTADGTAPPLARKAQIHAASNPNDFTLFRSTKTAGSPGTPAVEPNAANDRFGILATGNVFARRSKDNGLSFPDSLTLDTQDGQLYGGDCCDQLAYAVDRGSSSLVMWLIQDRYDADAEQSALRLKLFHGTNDLVDGSDTCDFALEPQRLGLDHKLWFDFNQMSHTSKYLYLTTNVRQATKTPDDAGDDPRVGAMVFQWKLDDLDDGNCDSTPGYWFLEGDANAGFSSNIWSNTYVSPVQQNGGSTMYFASHFHSGSNNDKLRIFSVADSSPSSLASRDKNIDNFKDVAGLCKLPAPNNTNPCSAQHPGRMTGFRSGSTIGWLFQADQDGNKYPFPYVQVVAFDTGSFDQVVDHQIRNDDFAWQLPSAAVNTKGDVGVVLYAMGGPHFPKAEAFIRTDPRNWDGIQMHVLRASDSGFVATPPSTEVNWGHFGSVRQYGNCPDTFLGSVYTTEAGVNTGRIAWFGAAGDACIDLADTSVSVDGAGPFTSGDSIGVTTSIQNQGSLHAPTSSISYYLSRDDVFDDSDIPFGTTRTAIALDPASTYALHSNLVIPPVFPSGEFHVVACADDPGALAEITETNNCFVQPSTHTFQRAAFEEERDYSVGMNYTGLHASRAGKAKSVRARGTFAVRETISARKGSLSKSSLPSVEYSLSRTFRRDDDEIAIPAKTVGAPHFAKRLRTAIKRLRLPKKTPRGRYWLVACLRHAKGKEDSRAANDCHILKKPLKVNAKFGTRGPARRRFFRGD